MTNTSIVTSAVEQFIKHQKKTWKHDRRQTIGASEIGQCARKIFCVKLEDTELRVPRNEGFVDTWGARERGNLIEQHLLVPAIRQRFGKRALFLGDEQQTFFDGYLSCTPDCILALDQGYILLEFKTIDPRVRLTEPKFEHVFQVQMQMGILQHLGEYPCQRAIISYTDASFLNETREFEVAFDQAFYDAAGKRAAEILTATSMQDILPEGWIKGGKECEYCAFSIACGRQRRDLPPEVGMVDPQFVAEIADLAVEYKQAQAVVEESEAMVRTLQTCIKTRLQEKRVRRVVGNGVSVSWAPVKARETTDVKALAAAAREAGIDVASFVSVGEPGDRLTITVQEEK